MVTVYLDKQPDGSYLLTAYVYSGEVARETYFDLYIARQRLYELEEEGYICRDHTR